MLDFFISIFGLVARYLSKTFWDDDGCKKEISTDSHGPMDQMQIRNCAKLSMCEFLLMAGRSFHLSHFSNGTFHFFGIKMI